MRETPLQVVKPVDHSGHGEPTDIEVREMITGSQKINEGRYGLIFKFNTANQGQAVAQSLGDDDNGDRVAKLIKVYSGTKGAQEFKMHSKIHEILAAAKNPEEVAQTPRPLLFKDMEMTPELESFLKKSGLALAPNRAEVIIMDYVPGDDLATILYREALKRHPNYRHISSEEIDKMDFFHLEREVQGILRFSQPGGKARDEGERNHEMMKVQTENAKILYTFLRRKGFILHPDIIKQMKGAVELCHKNGVALLDGHHRNWMVVGNYEALDDPEKKPRVMAIDFDEAVEFAGPLSDDVYQLSDGRRAAPEEAIIRELEVLTRPLEEDMVSERKDELVDLIAEARARIASPNWQKSVQKILDRRGGRRVFDVIDLEVEYVILSQSVEHFVALLIKLIDDGLITSTNAAEAVRKLVGGEKIRLSPAEENKLRLLLSYFEK